MTMASWATFSIAPGFVAADGSQIPEDLKPMFTVRIAPKESEAPKAEVKPYVGLSRQKIVALIVAGKTMADLAKEYGVHVSVITEPPATRAMYNGELVFRIWSVCSSG